MTSSAEVEDQTLQIGLLMEAAQAQQAMAETVLEKLKGQMSTLDDVVRDEIRRALVEELQVLGAESQRAAESLRRLGRAANARMTLWSVGLTLLCTAIPLCGQWWFIPSQHEIQSLRLERDSLAASVASLAGRGGRIDLRRCGGTDRLCVRVDRKAPAYGDAGDYLVVKGY
jgi:hypothetical protein